MLKFLRLFVLCLLAASVAASDLGAVQGVKTPLMPVREVRPGMHGEVHTVLQGTRIERVQTEILGVAADALGPGKDLIIGRLIDPKTALSGAVHGMSGSPLYIDGKLVGALSRRIMIFEKDGHCGFTPIHDMLEVGALPKPEPGVWGRGLGLATSARGLGRVQMVWGAGNGGADVTGELLGVPLAGSGLSGGVIERLLQWSGLQGLGWAPASGGGRASAAAVAGMAPRSGESGKGMGGELLEAGSAVSAVLMSGDLSLAGTGSLTWREGNRVLGFGHPMIGWGQVAWPMGTAEIITVVPSYFRPFKMANQGEVVGTIYQDRLSAIAGEVGAKPPMVPYRVKRSHGGREVADYRGEMVTHPRLVPMLTATALLSPLMNTDLSNRIFSMRVSGRLRLKELPDLRIEGVYAGEEREMMEAVFDSLRGVMLVFGQPWAEPEVLGLELEVATTEQAQVWTVEEVRVLTPRVAPGGMVRAEVMVRERYGQRRLERVEMRLPEALKTGEVELRVSGADEVRESELYRALGSMRDVRALVQQLNKLRSREVLELRLITPSAGRVVGDQEFPDVPPSVRRVMSLSSAPGALSTFTEMVWAEGQRRLNGVVAGQAAGRFVVER